MSDFDELLGRLRSAVAGRGTPTHGTRQALAEVEDPMTVCRAGHILAGLRPVDQDLRPIRVDVLTTRPTGPFDHLLRACLVAAGALPTLVPGDRSTPVAFEQSLASGGASGSDSPDLVACLMDERYFMPCDWNPTDPEALSTHLDARLADLRGHVLSGLRRAPAAIVLHTVPVPAYLRDTVISWRARAEVGRAWHQLNANILGLADEDSRIAVVDLAGELADAPFRASDERPDLPYTEAALLALARQVARVAQARLGLSRTVLAIGLDHILGNDLPEHHHLRRTVLRLRQQGVVLALAGKNDGLLRPEVFSVRAANRLTKAENLRRAASRLNLSSNAFVVLDDSPFERAALAGELPDVAVVAADREPAQLVHSLLRRGWFDVPELTDTDLSRPDRCRARALRTDFSACFASPDGYLHALRTRMLARPVTAFEVARVARLAAKANQFNLTGIRCDESVTTAMSADPGHLVASFALTDRFGDEGIVGAAWIERRGRVWWVLNLVLSGRVSGRGVELAIVEWIVRQAREAGASALAGRYVPTPSNGVAAGFWEKAGFTPSGEDGVFTLAPGTAPACLPPWITYGADDSRRSR